MNLNYHKSSSETKIGSYQVLMRNHFNQKTVAQQEIVDNGCAFHIRQRRNPASFCKTQYY